MTKKKIEKTQEVIKETPVIEYIGGKEIISSEMINDTTKKVIDIEGTTYLVPIE